MDIFPSLPPDQFWGLISFPEARTVVFLSLPHRAFLPVVSARCVGLGQDNLSRKTDMMTLFMPVFPPLSVAQSGNLLHPVFQQDFADEMDTMPKITMVNNVIHNNEGYGVILVKPSDAVPGEVAQEDTPTGMN